MSLRLRTAVVTDPGLIRSNNEDSAYASSTMIVVADGMGGLPAGELASEIVVRVLRELDERAPAGEAVQLLRTAVEEANDQVKLVADADPERFGMGTTVTAMVMREDQLSVVHVGDSRGYLLREGELAQVTVDDTYVQMLVEAGELDEAEVRYHPQRSLVTQAVQGGPIEPHCMVMEARPGDRLLICSDGLSDVVTDETIADVLGTVKDSRACADQLVKLTLSAGAPDNVTVLIADVFEDESA
jgi:protein phosphatase